MHWRFLNRLHSFFKTAITRGKCSWLHFLCFVHVQVAWLLRARQESWCRLHFGTLCIWLIRQTSIVRKFSRHFKQIHTHRDTSSWVWADTSRPGCVTWAINRWANGLVPGSIPRRGDFYVSYTHRHALSSIFVRTRLGLHILWSQVRSRSWANGLIEAPGSKPGISSGEILFLSYVTITPL